MSYESLSRETMKKVIEGRGTAERVPMMYHYWTHPEVFGENEETVLKLLEKYPYDVQHMGVAMPDAFQAPEDDPDYKWIYKDKKPDENVGLDAVVAIDDWEELDDILEHFPDPEYANLLPENPEDDGRYRLGYWVYCFFERLWSLRGMENALTDFYMYPDEVHRLFRALAGFYMRAMERCKDELHVDGIFFTDDIGTQNGPFFSEEMFVEFFKPYYKMLADKAHELGIHLWMHTCGNIEIFLPHLIEAGIDVIHPIQKYTMDEQKIAAEYGDKICILAGFDVQQTIPFGTPEEVRREVRHLIDTYYREDGRFILTCGNGLTADCPMESLEALLDETYHYRK